MPSDLEILKTLVRPPKEPKYSSGDWGAIEDSLGIEFPNDYKEFISVYGSGSLQSFIHIVNYLDNRLSSQELISVVFSQLETYKESGKCEEFKAYPDEGGLLPFANTDDGNYLFWVMDGEPNKWAVAAFDFSSGLILHVPEMGMVKCLLRLVQKDNPFDGKFCNIKNFNRPCTYTPWQEK